MNIDLTGVAVSFVGGFFMVLAAVMSSWVASKMTDKRAAAVVNQALNNGLGAMQQAATSEIQMLRPHINGVPAKLAPGVQYVLDQAGPELTRLGITPLALAQKLEAKVGLAEIATNLAVSGNASTAVAAPLAPMAQTTGAAPTTAA